MMIVQLVLSFIVAAAAPIEHPPLVSQVSVQELKRQAMLFDPIYDERIVFSYLAKQGPPTNELKKMLEDAETVPTAKAAAFDIRRKAPLFWEEVRIPLGILEQRAKTDDSLRQYLIEEQRYYVLNVNDDPEWLAWAMGKSAVEFLGKELLQWSKDKEWLQWSKDEERRTDFVPILRQLSLAANVKTPMDANLLSLLEAYADGTIGNTPIVESTAAMVLAEAGYKREHFEQTLRLQFGNPHTWADKSEVTPYLFVLNAFSVMKTRFASVFSVDSFLKAIQSLTPEQAKRALLNDLERSCAHDRSPQHNGARFVVQLLAARTSGESGELRLSLPDREDSLKTFAQLADRADSEAYRLVGQDWQAEKTPRLRYARFMLLLYSGAPNITQAQYQVLVDALAPKDNEEFEYGVSIAFGKAYFGDGKALREMLEEMVREGGYMDRLMPAYSLSKLISGTDFQGTPGNMVFFRWAVGNFDHLKYEPKSHAWQYDAGTANWVMDYREGGFHD